MILTANAMAAFLTLYTTDSIYYRKEADKVEVAPGVTVASLMMRRFRAVLIGSTQGLLSDVDCADRETRNPDSTES